MEHCCQPKLTVSILGNNRSVLKDGKDEECNHAKAPWLSNHRFTSFPSKPLGNHIITVGGQSVHVDNCQSGCI
eukprot:scaffold324013_cov17-Prasinocladus_malaysianus.AAC.1